ASLYGDTSTRIVDAEVVVDAEIGDPGIGGEVAKVAYVAPLATAAPRVIRLPLATQQTFAEVGLAGNAFTTGSTYVAANLADYVPERARRARLARPAHETRAARAPRLRSSADLRRRLMSAYGDGAETTRGRVTSVKA
ncbi:MAG: hypothetical protein Q4P32_12520, partial [Micrococcales bacterium]|nr:hypothetical protein [Micrococcales bacterium]